MVAPVAAVQLQTLAACRRIGTCLHMTRRTHASKASEHPRTCLTGGAIAGDAGAKASWTRLCFSDDDATSGKRVTSNSKSVSSAVSTSPTLS